LFVVTHVIPSKNKKIKLKLAAVADGIYTCTLCAVSERRLAPTSLQPKWGQPECQQGAPKKKKKTKKKEQKNNPKKQPTDFPFFCRCPLRRLWAVCGHATAYGHPQLDVGSSFTS
jgi:hypothetical protein